MCALLHTLCTSRVGCSLPRPSTATMFVLESIVQTARQEGLPVGRFMISVECAFATRCHRPCPFIAAPSRGRSRVIHAHLQYWTYRNSWQ